MVMNFNNSYMGGMNYGGNNMYTPNNVNFSGIPQGNVHLQYKIKYGTEDCFKHSPYQDEYVKPYTPLPQKKYKIPFLDKIKKNFF